MIVAEPLESVPVPTVALPLLASSRNAVSPLIALPPLTLTVNAERHANERRIGAVVGQRGC